MLAESKQGVNYLNLVTAVKSIFFLLMTVSINRQWWERPTGVQQLEKTDQYGQHLESRSQDIRGWK